MTTFSIETKEDIKKCAKEKKDVFGVIVMNLGGFTDFRHKKNIKGIQFKSIASLHNILFYLTTISCVAYMVSDSMDEWRKKGYKDKKFSIFLSSN